MDLEKVLKQKKSKELSALGSDPAGVDDLPPFMPDSWLAARACAQVKVKPEAF